MSREQQLAVALKVRIASAKSTLGLRVVDKNKSAFMKVLYYGALMFIWQREFMTRFTTTIGRTLYVPGGQLDPTPSGLALLNHEIQHIEDSRRFGNVLWAILYLFPQSLALLALVAIWWLPALGALVFLAPWPAPFRVWAERRGYERTLVTLKKCDGRPDVDRLRATFTGWAYWKMAWRWEPLRKRFAEALARE